MRTPFKLNDFYFRFFRLFQYFAILLAVICLSNPYNAFAAGMYLDNTQGLKFISSVDKHYWCKLSLLVKVDSYSFSDRTLETQILRIYGSRVRLAQICVNGSVNDHWSYFFKLNWNTFYAKYSGLGKDTLLFLGQVVIPFGLENACSSKWSPFLERSLPSYTFSPGYGIGLSFRTVSGDCTFSASLTTSAYGRRNIAATQPLQKTFRLTYAPIHEPCRVLHFGISARYQRLLLGNGLRFFSRPEIRLRNDPNFLIANFRGLNYCACLGLEFAALLGPFCVQTEITQGLVKPKPFIGDLVSNFKACSGGYVQMSYILTGESREYDFKSGTFGRIRPQTKLGAWDIAFRYSYLNLPGMNRNNLQGFNLRGGNEWSATFALGWTLNNHVRIFGNYIIAHINRNQGPESQQNRNGRTQKLEIFGLRLQWLY